MVATLTASDIPAHIALIRLELCAAILCICLTARERAVLTNSSTDHIRSVAPAAIAGVAYSAMSDARARNASNQPPRGLITRSDLLAPRQNGNAHDGFASTGG